MRKRTAVPLVVLALLAAACAERSPLQVPEAASFSGSGCELGIPLADAYAEINALIAEVDALEASGALNAGQARALRNHLNNARRHLDQGRTCPALAQLRAFRAQVGNFVRDGVLTPEQAAPLLEGIGRIIEGPTTTFEPGKIVQGEAHTCAIAASGRVYCWGLNADGQVGDGTDETLRLTPVPVATMQTFRQLVAGSGFNCALAPDGTVGCWGDNFAGQLGIGVIGPYHTTPVQVATEQRFELLAAGRDHGCGLTATGRAYCWGANFRGQVGDGPPPVGDPPPHQRPTPVAVQTELTFRSITASRLHTCALTPAGQAYCWGGNGNGQLGIGSTQGGGDSRRTPAAVSTPLTFQSISAGGSHTCGITTDGDVYCWGDNSYGQLGDGTTERRLVPVRVDTELKFVGIEGGGISFEQHTCAVSTAGRVYCWGANRDGQLGDGTGDDRVRPVATGTALTFRSLAGGGRSSCGISAAGVAYCWGANMFGQLGDGTCTSRPLPTEVLGWPGLP